MCKNILNPLIVHLLILDIGPDIEAYLNNQIDTQDNLTICPNLNIHFRLQAHLENLHEIRLWKPGDDPHFCEEVRL